MMRLWRSRVERRQTLPLPCYLHSDDLAHWAFAQQLSWRRHQPLQMHEPASTMMSCRALRFREIAWRQQELLSLPAVLLLLLVIYARQKIEPVAHMCLLLAPNQKNMSDRKARRRETNGQMHLRIPKPKCRKTQQRIGRHYTSGSVAVAQKPPLYNAEDKNNAFSLYIHWPYCESKCTYCSFNKYNVPAGGQNHERMEKALMSELQHSLSYSLQGTEIPKGGQRKVNSVYFGGGTPSLARPSMVTKILDLLSKNCKLAPGMEVSLEGNPTSIEVSRLREFRRAGVNRVSLGLQALNDADLRFFGRDHNARNAVDAVRLASEVFNKVSVDAIWGRPGQTVESWREELKEIASYGVSHLSLYQLTVERGTPLFRSVHSGSVTVPQSDDAADMYEATVETAKECGYHQYEVSSFARGGLVVNRSEHNQSYWKGADYIGIGPGAHGRLYDEVGVRFRTYRILDPEGWMRQCETSGHGMRRIVPMTKQQTVEELILLGLRTTDGLDFQTLAAHGRQQAVEEIIDVQRVQELVDAGLLQWGDERAQRFDDANGIRTSARGLAVVDRIVPELLR
ncbi:hypothetical protein DFJ77DRAFT_27598 [Powellomyces hirtus]|nr:hypothetical protein DFJ77DRAFT_27598 [Powellomyces hirtus]